MVLKLVEENHKLRQGGRLAVEFSRTYILFYCRPEQIYACAEDFFLSFCELINVSQNPTVKEVHLNCKKQNLILYNRRTDKVFNDRT